MAQDRPGVGRRFTARGRVSPRSCWSRPHLAGKCLSPPGWKTIQASPAHPAPSWQKPCWQVPKAAGATFLQAQVTGLSLSGTPKTVETTAGTYTAGAVILAMGAAPRKLPLPEAEGFLGRGLSYCATCDGMFFRGKTVAVLGGGNGAAASARSLARLCSQVHVIFRKDAMGADAREQEALAACSNVKLHPGTLLTGLSGQDRLEALTLEDRATGSTRELPCQGLFAAIGRIPETALLNGQVTLDPSGYVLAGETTQTSLPGVYAAGDIRTKPLRQIVTAAADGATAAHQAAQYLGQGAP